MSKRLKAVLPRRSSTTCSRLPPGASVRVAEDKQLCCLSEPIGAKRTGVFRNLIRMLLHALATKPGEICRPGGRRVERANPELFGYALDKVPASDRDAARPALVPGAAVGDGGFDGSRVDLRQRSGVADLDWAGVRTWATRCVSTARHLRASDGTGHSRLLCRRPCLLTVSDLSIRQVRCSVLGQRYCLSPSGLLPAVGK